MFRTAIRVMGTMTSIALMGAALSVAQPAAAVDGKTYAADSCQAWSNEAQYFRGTMNIDSNGPHTIYCPIVREQWYNLGISEAFIRVKDLSPVDDFECQLSSTASAGNVMWSTVRTSSGSSSEMQTLSFGSMNSVVGGTYRLSCRVPRANGMLASFIVTYQVNENE